MHDDLLPPPKETPGQIISGALVILFAIAVVILSAFWGCAPRPASPTVGLTNAAGDPVAITFPIQSYTPEFSAKLAQQLKTAPPELAQFTVDALKLRCAIKPSLPYCADLLR